MNFKELVLSFLEEAKVDVNLQAILDLNLTSSEIEWLKSLKEYDPHLIDALWIAKNWLKNKVDTFQEIRDQVTMFYKGRNRNIFNGSEKDIKTHKDYNKFKILIGNKTAGKTTDTRKGLHKSIKPIYEDSNIIVYKPTNKEESIALSHGHPAFDGNHYKFCVGAEGSGNLWDDYIRGRGKPYGNVFYFIRFKKRNSGIAKGGWDDVDNPVMYKDDKHILVLNISPCVIDSTFADNNTQQTSKETLLGQFPELYIVKDLLVPSKEEQEKYTKYMLYILDSGQIPQDYEESEETSSSYMEGCLKDENLKTRVINNILDGPYDEVINILQYTVSKDSFKQLMECFELRGIFSKYINNFKQELKKTGGVCHSFFIADNFILLKSIEEMVRHMIVEGNFSNHVNDVIPKISYTSGELSKTCTVLDNTHTQIITQNLNIVVNLPEVSVRAVVDGKTQISDAEPFNIKLNKFDFTGSIFGGDVVIWQQPKSKSMPKNSSQALEEIIKTLPNQIGGELYIQLLSGTSYITKKIDQNIVQTNVLSIKQQARDIYKESYENAIEQVKAYWAQV